MEVGVAVKLDRQAAVTHVYRCHCCRPPIPLPVCFHRISLVEITYCVAGVNVIIIIRDIGFLRTITF